MNATTIYLDNNATTALDPRVLEAMRPFFLVAGNVESRHSAGRRARRGFEEATELVAEILGSRPDEVVFTSGGTESNNLAIYGLAVDESSQPGRIATSPIEHPSVNEFVAHLEARGFVADVGPVDFEGTVDVDRMAGLFYERTRLATLMLANNETGTIQPVAKLADLAAARGVPIHTDAVQAVGKIPVDFAALGVDTLAASGHKFHGPAGSGVLLVRRGVRLTPRLYGGGQQRGRRPGTIPVALAVGFATALDLWRREHQARTATWRRLGRRLVDGLRAAIGPDRIIPNGPADPSRRLPQTFNLGFLGVDGDALLMQLDLAGVAVSLGSACASGSTQPSPTLVAMGVPDDCLRSSVRFSLGAFTTEDEIDQAVTHVAAAVAWISR
ncbi:cysteine desulfurase family protein [Planctomyces sp. SH-PL62]|uniref:cysteine desulfurase family protein n=1 Tax=Planctomyces sp. SH-PL62 TaxID=1636152 RepID=UPI00078CD064|nr:cysteine desulfurase family protein [Planctomyces sp. SH-PL62]AMV40807.1 Cysteine desulfurase [Planctomyces sp. SH-PL62]